jgi:hydroxylysine kinase
VTKITEDIKYLKRIVPQIAEEEVREALRTHYGIEGELRGLPSERDQNFDVRPQSGDRVVMRIANARENPGVIDFQVKALLHIADRNASLPVPKEVIDGMLNPDSRNW